MGRRSDHSREELKKMVVDVGSALIEEGGLAAFSTRKIADEIGYSVGTLYNVFENYDGIILHINARTLDRLEDHMAVHMDWQLTGPNALKKMAICYLSFAQTHINLWRTLFEYTPAPDTKAPTWYVDKITQLFRMPENALGDPQLPKIQNPTLASRTLWASVHGICILGLTGRLQLIGPISIEETIENLIDQYFS